jgi:hypothetical protein
MTKPNEISASTSQGEIAGLVERLRDAADHQPDNWIWLADAASALERVSEERDGYKAMWEMRLSKCDEAQARIAELEEMNQGNFILAGEFKDQLLEAMARIERLEGALRDIAENAPSSAPMVAVVARAALKEPG